MGLHHAGRRTAAAGGRGDELAARSGGLFRDRHYDFERIELLVRKFIFLEQVPSTVLPARDEPTKALPYKRHAPDIVDRERLRPRNGQNDANNPLTDRTGARLRPPPLG